MTSAAVETKLKMPISLKFAVGFVCWKIFCILLILFFQVLFMSAPPTEPGFLQGVYKGMQSSLGDKVGDPAYIFGYSLASLSLALPILPAAFNRSKRWLTAARVCVIVQMLANMGGANIPGAVGDLINVCLLFSKGAKRYVAKEAAAASPPVTPA